MLKEKPMVLRADERRSELEKIKSDGKPVTTIKLRYRDGVQRLNVYQIDLKYLIYNRYNDRIATRVETWQNEDSVPLDQYDDEIHDKIFDLLWKSNVARNEATFNDIKENGQLRPGVVTLDGVVVSGNRRLMILNKIPEMKYFEAAILEDAFHENVEEIVRLETKFQYEDPTLVYDPLQKYWKVKRLRDQFRWKPALIAKYMNEPKGGAEIERLLEIADLMVGYLKHVGYEGLPEMLRDDSGTKEGMFVDLQRDIRRLEGNTKNVQWDYDKKLDVLRLKTLQFDHIRFGAFTGTEKAYRQISHEGGGAQSIFAFKELWQEFYRNHFKSVDNVTIALPNLDEYQTSKGIGTKYDAARALDEKWKEEVGPAIKGNFGRATEKLDVRKNVVEPTRLLEKARNLLLAVVYDNPQFVEKIKNLELVKEIGNLAFSMKKKFEKSKRG